MIEPIIPSPARLITCVSTDILFLASIKYINTINISTISEWIQAFKEIINKISNMKNYEMVPYHFQNKNTICIHRPIIVSFICLATPDKLFILFNLKFHRTVNCISTVVCNLMQKYATRLENAPALSFISVESS